MSNKIQKVRADLQRRLDIDNTNLTAHRDYDFERRSTDMKRLGHAIDHFSHAVTQGMMAMKEIASAFEAVGQAFTELTLGTVNATNHGTGYEEVNPFPTEADMQNLSAFNLPQPENERGLPMDYARSVASTRLTDETNSQVRRLAKIFAEETRKMNEGTPFQSYNAGMHRDVVVRLLPVSEHLKSVEEYRQQRSEALDKYNKYKAEVEKVEKQYTKKGKPFCDSKSHKKYAAKRDEAWKEYVKKRDKFNETFMLLMEVNDHAAAQIIHRYLALNDEYLRHLIESIGRIMPAMEEIYPLNSEYTTAQNSMILDAVATAKTPFKHHHTNPNEGMESDKRFSGTGKNASENNEDGEEAEAGAAAAAAAGGAQQEGGNAPNGDSDTATTSSALNSMENTHHTDNAENVVPGGPVDLEEPQDDDDKKHIVEGGENTMNASAATEQEGAQQPPHDMSEEDDAVKAAGATSTDLKYQFTQQSRLQTNDTAAADNSAVVPGAVREDTTATVSPQQ